MSADSTPAPWAPVEEAQAQVGLGRFAGWRPAENALVGVLFVSIFFDALRLQMFGGLFNIRPSFVVAAIVFPILAVRWLAAREPIQRTPVLPVLLGLDACFFVSTAINWQSPVQLRGFITCALLFVNITFFAVVYWHAHRVSESERLFRLVVAIAALYSLAGMLALILNQLGFAPAHSLVEFRTMGNWTMGDPSQDALTPRPWFLEPNIGSYLAAIGVMAFAKTLLSSAYRWLYGLSAALILTGVLLTYSRGAWLGAIVGGATIVALLIWYRSAMSIRPVALIGLLGALATSLVVLVTAVPSIKTVVVARLENLVNVGQGTGLQRLDYWSTITEDSLRQPILGHGANAYQLLLPHTCPAISCPRYVAENATVEIFHTSGIVGLALYVAIAVTVVVLFRKSVVQIGRSSASRAAAIAGIGGYASLLVSSQLNPSFWGNMYWALFGLAIALMAPVQSDAPSPSPPPARQLG
jgi:O-antigen ligase